MKLEHGIHLAYCTNIHRGETWPATFENLKRYGLAVRREVAPSEPYAIGLRLSAQAARELSDSETLNAFRRWLERHDCYVFTVNGFPFGAFHGKPVKEGAYLPDWTSPERLGYTNLLFDLMGQLVPKGIEGSVSTVPVTFKEFKRTEREIREARWHLWSCVEHIEQVCRQTGKRLHLGLEPEPLCYLETTEETAKFFAQMRNDRPGDLRLDEHLGVNYDCCHLAVEYENPSAAIGRLIKDHIRISKIHLSSALKVHPTREVREALASFADDVYFHQVIERTTEGRLKRYRDLGAALSEPLSPQPHLPEEWRIHFHIPVHSLPTGLYDNTGDHLVGVLDMVKENPGLCPHFEIETYTWEVLPAEMKNPNVVEQLVAEYRWVLEQLARRGLSRR